ncbi:ATP-binding cassette domain-containing protein [Salinibius halmophilus]|uniref:ATP-binding cassette domain-containing protein n=1 Tax=Salinibius halmophilus TaxID=1853216 RepID=UPI000E675263|nr:ATP-binding cassette domain-containing protein [Salinibius halmophilus]
MINVEHLQWLDVIHRINLTLKPGRFYALVGPNGSGKSSLLGLLAGTRKPCAGKVSINQQALSQLSLAQLACMRAVMPQSVALNFPLPVVEVVKLGAIHTACDSNELVDNCLELVGMLAAKDKLYNRLSGGQQQRVQLARVLCQLGPLAQAKGKWLLLDEATSSLDLQYQHQVFAIAKYLARLGVGVVSVVHDVNLAAKYADEVLVLKNGELVQQGLVENVVNHQLADSLYNLPAATLKDPQYTPVISVARQEVA